MSFNPYSDPVARELHSANAELRGIRDKLWDPSQSPEVQAARQAERAAKTGARISAVGVVLGLVAAWVVLSLVFGRAGQRLFGSLLGLAWDALGVLIVLGAAVGVLRAVVRVGPAVVGAGRRNYADGVE